MAHFGGLFGGVVIHGDSWEHTCLFVGGETREEGAWSVTCVV